jgi:hypothetical protein
VLAKQVGRSGGNTPAIGPNINIDPPQFLVPFWMCGLVEGYCDKLCSLILSLIGGNPHSSVGGYPSRKIRQRSVKSSRTGRTQIIRKPILL